MPSTFLTFKERERLTCFPDEVPQWDLITYFTLTEHDSLLIDTYQSATNRLATALQLGAVRYLGFCPADLHTAPSDVIAFLADQLQVEPDALQDYGKRRMTRSTYFNAVLHHLGFRRVHPGDHKAIIDWLIERALEHDNSIFKLFQIDITGMFRMTSRARYFKEGVDSSRPNWRWIMCFLEWLKANTSCKAVAKRVSFS